MKALTPDLAKNPVLSRWISVEDDGRLAVRTGKVELGQGAVTAIVSLAAQELGVSLSRLRVVAGDTRRAPDEGITSGSQSIEQGGEAMRYVAALVRELFEAAARRKAGAHSRMQHGRFAVDGGKASYDYLDLRNDVDLDVLASDLPVPSFIGNGSPGGTIRLDLPAKLFGAAFIHDIDEPGMCHGRVLRPPHPGARLEAFDRPSIEGLPGVLAVLVDGSFVGLVARTEHEADIALKRAARVARWHFDAKFPSLDEECAWMEAATPLQTAEVVCDDGPEASVASRLQAAYSRPYLAHASLAPSCAVAQWRDGGLLVHSHTQNVYPLRAQLAAALDVPQERVDVVHVMGAGCYGHNGADDVALDAALLARAAKVPVMCRWSRSDELTWSPFGPAMRMRLSAGLDADGRIVDWTHDVFSPPHLARPIWEGGGVDLLAAWHREEPRQPTPPRILPGPVGTGERNAVPLYKVGRRRITHHLLPQFPVRTSALRSLGAHGNVFAIECFLDELAALSNQDPIAFRLAHLEDERARTVIERASALAAWDDSDAGGEGVGRGIGFARYKNSGGYCAVVARVEVTDTIRVTHVHTAVDCGTVVHRDGLLNQVEGGIVQAISWTLKEQVRWNEEGFVSCDWENYPILSFGECPDIQVDIIDSEGEPPLGSGECAAGPTSAAIGNAVSHALGIRIRHMPITAAKLMKEIHSRD